METQTVPKLRFSGFTSDWEQRKLQNLAQFSKGAGYTKNDLQESGTPIILYGRLYTKYQTVIDEVDTYATPKSGSVYSKGGEVIVPASGETAEDISIASVVKNSGVLLGGDLNIITADEIIDPTFLAISISYGKPHNDMAKMAQGKSIVHLHNSDLQKVDMIFPSLEEQRKIASVFNALDNTITLHQRKCDEIKVLKKGMLQKMFPKEGESVPEIRFPDFNDAWEQRKFGDLCSIVTKQTGFDYTATIKKSLVKKASEDTLPYLQTKNFAGVSISYETDYFIPKSVAKEFPKINLDEKCLLFSIVGASVGNIGLFPGDKHCFLSGAICVSKLNNHDDADYLYHYMCSENGQSQIRTCTKGGAQATITIEDIREFCVLLPSEQERKKIGELLSSLDNLITLHQRKCDNLKTLKTAMLQQMFV